MRRALWVKLLLQPSGKRKQVLQPPTPAPSAKSQEPLPGQQV